MIFVSWFKHKILSVKTNILKSAPCQSQQGCGNPNLGKIALQYMHLSHFAWPKYIDYSD